MTTTAQNILKDLIAELRNVAKTETIVGAPFSAGEYTLVPISRVALGVGAGGGSGETDKKASTGEGGGGGGGVRVVPVALVAVRGGELNIHLLGRGAAVTHTMEKVPEILEKGFEKLLETWASRKEKREKDAAKG
jgi:uncharacterized spore protein YtfJ